MSSLPTGRKRAALLKLAMRRQVDRHPPHCNIADFHGSFYECDHVSPWTISACNVDAELMLIGQDWASAEVLNQPPNDERRRLGQDWSSRTNSNLRRYLDLLGLSFCDTYATNVFTFIKGGRKSGRIPFNDLVRCAQVYTIPEIEIVAPRIAVCFGKKAFDAVRGAADQDGVEWDGVKTLDAYTQVGSTRVYGLPHPGGLGTNNAGGAHSVEQLWKRLGRLLRE